jgi:hypothetical protein
MDKIDRLGWAAGMAIRAYGVRIGIRVNDATALPRLEASLPPGWTPLASPVVDLLFSVFLGGSGARRGVRRYNLLYGSVVRLARSLEPEEVFDAFESYLHLHLAEAARRRLFVHAGVVGWRGQAIVVPGRSHSGKSTLVAALLRAGATYYSDEYAVLDDRGRVHPYAKPLSLRDREDGKATPYRVEALGGRVGKQPLPIGLVIMSHYRPGVSWRPRLLSPGQGALALLQHTVSARRQPATALAMLQKVVRQARVLTGGRGEAEIVAPAILRYLG